MALRMQRLTCSIGEPATFWFTEEVAAFVAGISWFSLTYGNTDHEVYQMELSLNYTSDANQITVTPQATMQDGSGHSLNTTESTVTITVLAWTGTLPNTVAIGQVLGLTSGDEGPSGGIPVPGSPVQIGQAILSGFNLQYSSQHNVLHVSAGASPMVGSSLGYISASAAMRDGSGNNAQTATIDGQLLMASASVPGFVTATATSAPGNQAAVQVPVTMPDAKKLTGAAVFLTSFTVAYPGSGDHYVKTIGAGVTDWCVSNVNVVTLSNLSAFMQDNSGHTEDDSSSSAQVVVIGILEEKQ
jgi:hypothetical protein